MTTKQLLLSLALLSYCLLASPTLSFAFSIGGVGVGIRVVGAPSLSIQKRNQPFHTMAIQMSSSSSTPPPPVEEEEAKKVSADGTYYDDEVEPIEKVGISESMKDRLLREATTGLDPDRKQTNVLLYIMGVVAILALLAGQGIFY